MKYINEYNSFKIGDDWLTSDDLDNINDLFFMNFEKYKLIEVKAARSWSLRDDIWRSKDYNDNKDDKNYIFYNLIQEGDSIFLCINFDTFIKYNIDSLLPLFYKRISKFGLTKFGDKTSCGANGCQIKSGRYGYGRIVYNIVIKRIVKKEKKVK